jgi:uncharacterized membrane protein (UPF0127 family)
MLGFAGAACFKGHATIPALSAPIKGIGAMRGAAGSGQVEAMTTARFGWLKALAPCLAVVLVAAALLRPVGGDAAEGEPMILPVDPAPLVAVTGRGERHFFIEIADEPSERQAGLMFRKTMADDHGMLFVFEATQPVGFWMRNTVMPLDLVFIGQDGRVKAIRQGEPFSEAVISPDEPVRFVLELKAGTAAKEGIADGDLVRHPAIATAPAPRAPPADIGGAPNANDKPKP